MTGAELSATAGALDAIHPRYGFDLTAEGPEWHPYPTLPERLGEWSTELIAAGRAPAEVAMSLLSGVMGPVVRPVALAWVLRGELLAVDAGTVAVRRRGRVVDRAALRCEVRRTVDPAPLAALLAELLAPVVDALHTHTRFGRRTLWGGLADHLASHTLWAGRHAAEPPAALQTRFAQVQAVLDGVADRVSVRFPRPRPYPVRETLTHVRGTCCLHYRIPGRAHGDGTPSRGSTPPAPAPRYCSTCPLLDEDTRREKLATFVEATTRTAHRG
jgi:ferric iron reductase protein FhuF